MKRKQKNYIRNIIKINYENKRADKKKEGINR